MWQYLKKNTIYIMKKILNTLFEHQTLTKLEAREILGKIAEGTFNECEIASFLTVFAMRPITVDELTGFVEELQDRCIKINLSDFDTIDMCGTGGDGKNTFNISTLASFLVAGAGYKVAKHGNYGVSSGCGSSNVLEALGYTFSNEEDKLKADIERSNICFLHAPLFHPAMKNVAPVRRSLGIRTFFNMVGPLVNPSFTNRQAVGVFNLELARLYKYLLQNTSKEFIIIHGLDGFDEISLTGDVKVISRKEEKIITPELMGLPQVKLEEIGGGETVEEATKIFTQIISGNGTEAQNNVVIANAATGIKCFKPEQSLIDCVAEAKESLESGKAHSALKNLLAK